MKVMYDRQARALVEKNRGTTLSKETMDLYSAYLMFQSVGSSTKVAILRDLVERTASEADARTLVDSHIIEEFLASAHPTTRQLASRLVAELAQYESLAGVATNLNLCFQLAHLLKDENCDIIQNAIVALAWISTVPSGADAILETDALAYIKRGLDSPDAKVRKMTCRMLNHVAATESGMAAVLALNPCMRLVSLLRDKDEEIVEYATATLARASESAGVVSAVAETKLPRYAMQLLYSPSREVRSGACCILGNLSSHKSTAMTVLAQNPCVRLLQLLGDDDIEVRKGAIRALATISMWPDGVQALSAANAPDRSWKLSTWNSRDPKIKEWTRLMVGNLEAQFPASRSVVQFETVILFGLIIMILRWLNLVTFVATSVAFVVAFIFLAFSILSTTFMIFLWASFCKRDRHPAGSRRK
ncbi:armadillo-type protein [Mycena vulgaris]|nr:armadillo-type protein [Mycena vulgaris]